MSKPTLLAVMAHPDDESFGIGGTLATYASRGADVFLVCATRGEVGDVSPEMLDGYDSIAQLREAELRCAAGKLGLADVFFLGYRDSGMPGSADNSHPLALAAQPVDTVAGKIVRYMRQLRPDVVLTFDPIGGYRHPDHVAVHNATVRAFQLSGDASFSPDGLTAYTPRAMYFHVYPKRLLRWAVRIMPLLGQDPHRYGANKDIDIASFASEDFPVHARIDVRGVMEQKTQAAACHASQGGGTAASSPIVFILRRLGQSELFMQAYPPVPNVRKVSRDLLTPINDNGKAG